MAPGIPELLVGGLLAHQLKPQFSEDFGHFCRFPEWESIQRSGRHADPQKANKVGIQLRFAIFQQHGNHLLQVDLQLIEAFGLAVGGWKTWQVAHEQAGVGAALDHCCAAQSCCASRATNEA